MSKEVFKKGDKVYHVLHGWGLISSIESLDIGVDFVCNARWLSREKNILSFTEYTLQGFSQERPIELPEVGELCLFRNFDCDDWLVRKFNSLSLDMPRKYITTANNTYRQMKRIKILD
jgi:hypothetical protein